MAITIKRMIGNRIKLARKERKRSQAWLAEEIGVHQTSVTQWETGRTDPTTENLSRIANALDVNFEWLAKGTGDMTGVMNKINIDTNIFYSTTHKASNSVCMQGQIKDLKEIYINKLSDLKSSPTDDFDKSLDQVFDDIVFACVEKLYPNKDILEFIKLFDQLPKSKRETLLTFMKEWVK